MLLETRRRKAICRKRLLVLSWHRRATHTHDTLTHTSWDLSSLVRVHKPRQISLVALESRLHEFISLQDSSTVFRHCVCVYLMFVSHMRVLLTALLEGLLAAHNRTSKRLFTGVDSQVIFKSAHWLATPTTIFTSMATFTWAISFVQGIHVGGNLWHHTALAIHRRSTHHMRWVSWHQYILWELWGSTG